MTNYFSDEELRCKCGCGQLVFDEKFRSVLNSIRADCGFPFPVASGYRCPNHPIEKNKSKLGEHTTGCAVDVAVAYEKAYAVIESAMRHGIKRIGVSQRLDPESRFIHLGCSESFPSPTIWSY